MYARFCCPQHIATQITVGLLQKGMVAAGKPRVLIDGFPRNVSNRETFLKLVRWLCIPQAPTVRGKG
jgi:hypothetical protein